MKTMKGHIGAQHARPPLASRGTPLCSASWGTSYTSTIRSSLGDRGIQPPWEQPLGPLQVQRTQMCKHSTLLRFFSCPSSFGGGTGAGIRVWHIIHQGWTGESPGQLFQLFLFLGSDSTVSLGNYCLGEAGPELHSPGSNPVLPLPAVWTRTCPFTSRTPFPRQREQ